MSGTYVLWVNFGYGWNIRLVAPWGRIDAAIPEFTDKGGRCLTTFCPPGRTPHRDDLMVHL